MGEFNSEHNLPNLYERLAPESRFVRIAGTILEHKSPDANEQQTKHEYTWPEKPEGHWYKIQVTMIQTMFGLSWTFSLEHHIAELPANRSLVRYNVTTDAAGGISPMSVFDANNKEREMSEEDRRLATWQALSILTEAAPKEAKDIFDNIVEYRFANLVGAYVLSDLALEGTTEKIDEFAAWLAAEKLTERIEEIEDKILDKSARKDSSAKHETIEEAVETRRTKTDKNNYKPVDMFEATDRFAKLLGKKWINTVQPKQ